jgi:small multidrug resistance pump
VIAGVILVETGHGTPAVEPTAFSLLTLALAHGMPVGIAYGIWAASGVALTAVGARVFFQESLTWRMTAGIVLIAIGVFVIELGSQAH